MQRLSRNGAFCVLTSPLNARSHVRWISSPVGELGRARTGSAAAPVASPRCGTAARNVLVVVVGRRPTATTVVAAATSSGSHAVGRPRRSRGSAPARRRRCPGLRAMPTSRPRSFAGEVVLAVGRLPAEVGRAPGATSARDARAGRRRTPRPSTSRPTPRSPTAIACHTARSRSSPNPSTNVEEVERAEPSGDDRVPRVVDEVVAIDRRQLRERRRRPAEPAASSS